MKALTLIAVMSMSLSVFGQKHADEKIEKGCYAEAVKAGCVRNNGEEVDRACTTKNKSKLTKTCHPLLGVQ